MWYLIPLVGLLLTVKGIWEAMHTGYFTIYDAAAWTGALAFWALVLGAMIYLRAKG